MGKARKRKLALHCYWRNVHKRVRRLISFGNRASARSERYAIALRNGTNQTLFDFGFRKGPNTKTS